MHILWNVHLVPKTLQKIWIWSKTENQIRVCLDLKTNLHSCYGLNSVHPWLPMWWTSEIGLSGSTHVDIGFWWWSLIMGLASPSFSFLFSLFHLAFPHHMCEHSKRNAWCKSRMSLLGSPPPWYCVVSSLWQPVGLRVWFCSYRCQMMKYIVHDTVPSYICYVWNCLVVRSI